MLSPVVQIILWIFIGTGLFGIILLLLPTWPLPDVVYSAFEWFFTNLWGFNAVLPVQTLLTALYIAFFVDILFISVRVVIWIFSFFTGKGSSSGE